MYIHDDLLSAGTSLSLPPVTLFGHHCDNEPPSPPRFIQAGPQDLDTSEAYLAVLFEAELHIVCNELTVAFLAHALTLRFGFARNHYLF